MISAEYKPVIRFLLFAFSLFIGWYFVYDLWLHPMGTLDSFVVNNSISGARFFLEFFGFDVFIEPRIIGITTTKGVWIGDSCNAVALFALFSGFIIAFPSDVISKLFFIIFGILSIHLLNILRITALAVVDFHYPSALSFNHTYTFTFLIYGYIFLLWMIWVKRNLSLIKKASDSTAQ